MEAVKDLTLEVGRGESFGFLGHNGAGKTTTIKCIMNLIRKTKGRIFLEGHDLTGHEKYRSIGYLPEQPYFYDHLTVYETLDFFSRLHGIRQPERAQRISETLEMTGIANRAKTPVRTLSKGLQQRLGFAQAILNKPKLLMLDEPFTGLDPLGRSEIRRLVLDLHGAGTTIFLSSHILSDVADICDRVGIMAWGKLEHVFSLDEIPELYGQSFEMRIRTSFGDAELPAAVADQAVAQNRKETLSGIVHTLQFSDYDRAAGCMNEALAQGLHIESFHSSGPSLEDVFVSITAGGKGGKRLL
jgi:ABC-2 type transport system ATP-binding protein